MTSTTTAKPGEGPVLLGRFPGADEPGSSTEGETMHCSNEHFGIPPADVTVENHGTLVLVRPETDAATAWLNENVDECVWFAGALVVEPRYVEGLLLGMADEGFMVRAGA